MAKIHPSTSSSILRNQKVAAEKALHTKKMYQVPCQKQLRDLSSKLSGIKSGFKPLSQRLEHRAKEEASKAREKGDELGISKDMEKTAYDFNRKNDELLARTLMMLRGLIKETDTKEDILEKVLEIYPDYSLADEALDYLIETSHGTLRNIIQQAKDELNARYGREIIAGKNIAAQAREFSQQGLGSPTALRDIYRDVTGNPRDVHTLFEEFARLFDYEKMKTASYFLFHSLGADLKAKGPSISRGELARLLEDTRTLQAILGVYLFFKERMKLIYKQFTNYDLDYPERLTFEVLAQKFMQLINERYVSPERVRQLAKQLGLSDELTAQIIIFMQMRDAIRQISPRIYRNQKHKEEVLSAIIETLEDLEEEDEENDL